MNEGLVPIQVSKGSHEDAEGPKELPRVMKGMGIMSWAPSIHYWAKSWLPDQDIEGCLIPHGEAFSIWRFFQDKETGWAPTQYYVYDFNPYAQNFVKKADPYMDLHTCNPEMEVIHPMNYPTLVGVDKVGALLLFNNNRGYWAGTIVDDKDAAKVLKGKFGPTVLQVAAGVWAAYLWMVCNPESGNRWPESISTDFILQHAKPYLGTIASQYVDLTKTHIKDCKKFESFVTRKFQGKTLNV